MRKTPILTITLLVVVLAAGAAWYLMRPAATPEEQAQSNTNVNSVVTETPTTNAPLITDIQQAEDADRDGLTDGEEATLGTDPTLSDTDSDGLADGVEVNVYKTDPLNPDTDADGYRDGEEVRSGNNPNGSGSLLDLTNAIETLSGGQ